MGRETEEAFVQKHAKNNTKNPTRSGGGKG
jgi:hypothetical protein